MASDLTRTDDAGQRRIPTGVVGVAEMTDDVLVIAQTPDDARYGEQVRTAERSAAERLRDSRSRRFAEIESAIIAEERAFRRLVWEIPRYDVRVRLLAAQRIAHRKEHLAESARLSEARRIGIDARADATRPRA